MPVNMPQIVTDVLNNQAAQLKSSEEGELRRMWVESITANSDDGSAGEEQEQTVLVNIVVNAVGDEAEYAFTLNYDASVLRKPIIGVGNTTATVRMCNTQVGGAIKCSVGGFATNNPLSIDAGIGEIEAGDNQILMTVQFTVTGNAPSGETQLKLSKVNAASDAPQLLTVVGTPTNVVVNIPAFTPGTYNPVVVTFTTPNPGFAVDFTQRSESVPRRLYSRAV